MVLSCFLCMYRYGKANFTTLGNVQQIFWMYTKNKPGGVSVDPFLTFSNYHTHSKLICTLEEKEDYCTFIFICIMVTTHIILNKTTVFTLNNRLYQHNSYHLQCHYEYFTYISHVPGYTVLSIQIFWVPFFEYSTVTLLCISN